MKFTLNNILHILVVIYSSEIYIHELLKLNENYSLHIYTYNYTLVFFKRMKLQI